MRIIISPAKRMNTEQDWLPWKNLPVFLDKAEQLHERLSSMSYAELKKLLCCNDQIAELNYKRYQQMDIRRPGTSAILAYDGIQYKYMAPQVFEDTYYEYIEEHLRILSGFYGVLRPFDGVTPYRLEMQAKLQMEEKKNLYAYWGDALCLEVMRDNDDGVLINLASEEYAKAVISHLPEKARCVTCIFGEMIDGKVIEKGVYVKMARGEMVRFMAERNIRKPEEMKAFDRLGFRYEEGLSDRECYVFLK